MHQKGIITSKLIEEGMAGKSLFFKGFSVFSSTCKVPLNLSLKAKTRVQIPSCFFLLPRVLNLIDTDREKIVKKLCQNRYKYNDLCIN